MPCDKSMPPAGYGTCLLPSGHDGPCMDVSGLADGEMEPRYVHDCSHCTFVGYYDEYDLWFHDGGDRPHSTTVIARWSDENPGDYMSGLCFIARSDPLAQAARNAIALGLLSPATPTGGANQGGVADELLLTGDKRELLRRDLQGALDELNAALDCEGLPAEVKGNLVRAAVQLSIVMEREKR